MQQVFSRHSLKEQITHAENSGVLKDREVSELREKEITIS